MIRNKLIVVVFLWLLSHLVRLLDCSTARPSLLRGAWRHQSVFPKRHQIIGACVYLFVVDVMQRFKRTCQFLLKMIRNEIHILGDCSASVTLVKRSHKNTVLPDRTSSTAVQFRDLERPRSRQSNVRTVRESSWTETRPDHALQADSGSVWMSNTVFMFQLMDITSTGCLNASTAPVITGIWCIFSHIPSIKLCMSSTTALWGSLWGSLRKEWNMQRTSTKTRPSCSSWKLQWTHSAYLMLRSLTHLSVINQVSAAGLFSHLCCSVMISDHVCPPETRWKRVD